MAGRKISKQTQKFAATNFWYLLVQMMQAWGNNGTKYQIFWLSVSRDKLIAHKFLHFTFPPYLHSTLNTGVDFNNEPIMNACFQNGYLFVAVKLVAEVIYYIQRAKIEVNLWLIYATRQVWLTR